MTEQGNNGSFGAYLKSVRLEKGIDINHIAASTRISRERLLLLESENHRRLPSVVFVKGFIRSYAQVVGADSSHALSLFTESFENYGRTLKAESELNRPGGHFWPKLLLALLVLIGIIAISILITSMLQATEPMAGAALTEPMVAPAAMREEPVIEKNRPDIKYKVLLKGIKTSPLKVIIDNHDFSRYILNQGDLLKIEAERRVNLLIEEPESVSISVNGRTLPTTAKNGQAITITIP